MTHPACAGGGATAYNDGGVPTGRQAQGGGASGGVSICHLHVYPI